MKRINPTNCSEKEFRKLIGIPEDTGNECRITTDHAINNRKRKLLEIPKKIVCEHNNGGSSSCSNSGA
jgi:hypothetical protein